MDAHMQSRGSWSPWDEIDRLKAENERLRSILQEMLRHGQTTVSKKRIKAALIDGEVGQS